MYIEPNSTIKLYKNVPLDSTYNHTLFFQTMSQQNNYFHGTSDILKYTLTNQSYQRVVKGSMRVEVRADNLYDCNYLAFVNTSFGNKWFYAFITGVEYVNNETSDITFEIDVMQTYFFDVTLKPCFVEREHASTDTIGSNIQPEPVELGEYINSSYDLVGDTREQLVLIMIADEDASDSGNLYDGIYGGCDIWAYNSTDTTNITSKINEYIQKPDQIVGIYMCPKILIPSVTTGGKKLSYSASSSKNYVRLNSVSDDGTSFGDYTPKNNKLYTYPYNFVHIDNNSGQSLNLRYEFFEDLTPVIEISGTFLMPVKLVAHPCSYKGYPGYTELGGYTPSTAECLTMENYPMCSWNVDSFKAWVAQNSVPIAVNAISSVTSAAMASSFSSRPYDMPSTSAVGGVANTLSHAYQASIAADQCRGNVANGNVNVSRNRQAFYKTRCHITADYAQTIDEFFNVYGYATNKVKIPNRNVRLRWTYVKTRNCVLVANAPADDVRKICQIYDNGITFWRNPSDVGNYFLNNAIG